MSYRPQMGSRRSAGRGGGKTPHEKSKAKEQKKRSSGKYLLEERQVPTSEEIVEKTLGRLNSLAGQIFAFSPFSQYFDDWLLSLRSVLSEFELNPVSNVDDEFVKERSQVISNVELKLAERRREEAALGEAVKRLADQNHLLVEIDVEYAKASREISLRKNIEIQRLTRNVHDLEEELDQISRMKTSIFTPFSKKTKSHRKAEATQKLNSAKGELESVVQNFTVEQEKLHDEYEKKKQAVIEQVRNLEKDVEVLETDGSAVERRVACEALVNAVNAFLQRKASSLP
jgi:hypothetical protein